MNERKLGDEAWVIQRMLKAEDRILGGKIVGFNGNAILVGIYPEYTVEKSTSDADTVLSEDVDYYELVYWTREDASEALLKIYAKKQKKCLMVYEQLSSEILCLKGEIKYVSNVLNTLSMRMQQLELERALEVDALPVEDTQINNVLDVNVVSNLC
jgi:hypothetical protein